MTAPTFPSSPDEFEIDCARLHEWRESGAALRLIDCREEDEFALNRIEGAEWIPLSRFAEEAAVKLLASEEPIKSEDEAPEPVVVYCHHGMRSLQATHYLRQRGFEAAWSLAGGIEAWSQQIDPQVPRY